MIYISSTSDDVSLSTRRRKEAQQQGENKMCEWIWDSDRVMSGDHMKLWDDERAERRMARFDLADIVVRAEVLLAQDGVLTEEFDDETLIKAIAHTIFDEGYDHLWHQLLAQRRYIMNGDETLEEVLWAMDSIYDNDDASMGLRQEFFDLQEYLIDAAVIEADEDEGAIASPEVAAAVAERFRQLPREIMVRSAAKQLTVGDVRSLMRLYNEAVGDHLGIVFGD
jgi:hypothetical protein